MRSLDVHRGQRAAAGTGHREAQGEALATIGGFADRRKNVLRNPLLERAGLGFVGTHNQLVEAAFGNQVHIAVSPSSLHPMKAPLGFVQIRQRASGVDQPQRPADIRRDEPRGAVNGHDADREVEGAAAGHGEGSRTEATQATLALSRGPPEYTSSVRLPTS